MALNHDNPWHGILFTQNPHAKSDSQAQERMQRTSLSPGFCCMKWISRGVLVASHFQSGLSSLLILLIISLNAQEAAPLPHTIQSILEKHFLIFFLVLFLISHILCIIGENCIFGLRNLSRLFVLTEIDCNSSSMIYHYSLQLNAKSRTIKLHRRNARCEAKAF